MGSCLTIAEQRSILRKAKIHEKNLGDYAVHGLLVRSADEDSVLSRRLHHHLENKFRNEIREWGFAPEQTFLDLWEEHYPSGEPSALLYIMATHPCLSVKTLDRLFGDIHMLMHKQGELYRNEMILNRQLNTQIEQLTRKLQSSQTRLLELTRELKEAGDSHKKCTAPAPDIIPPPTQSPRGAPSLSLSARFRAERRIRTLTDSFTDLKEENKILSEELASVYRDNRDLRSELLQRLENTRRKKEDCDSCPNAGLCDKQVLLVGGISRLRPSYRNLVEDLGGRFRHHEGTSGGGERFLEEMIGWADIVLCPVDVNSHGACLGVKKICKKMNKPYRMLTSSGLSSFGRVLTEHCGPGEFASS